ncbi:MAG: PAS domain-containing sensor histidine kinase [Magnetospiraceae bacterium]
MDNRDAIAGATSDEARELIHDLSVYQIELELQNEELRRAHEQMMHSRKLVAEARDRYLNLYNKSPVGYLSANADGMIVECNATFENLINQSSDTINGVHLAQFIDSRDRPEFRARYRAFFHKPENKHLELRLCPKGKPSVWVELEGRSVGADKPETALILLIIHDIQDRKEMEAEIVSARMQAEKANEAKSEFLAAMSHDLRTPLNAIMGFADMLRQNVFGPLGDPLYQQYANDIHNSGALLVSLINDILDLSKVEAGKYDLRLDPLNILAVVNQCLRQHERSVMDAAQHVTITVPPDFPLLNGDERALIQILNNLISNAVKFTPRGGSITISATIDDENRISIAVADSGIGMPKSEIARVLKPFEQADSLRSQNQGGTGLGLHLCSRFMDLFGGELRLESAVQVGTMVTLIFPADLTLAAPNPPP